MAKNNKLTLAEEWEFFCEMPAQTAYSYGFQKGWSPEKVQTAKEFGEYALFYGGVAEAILLLLLLAKPVNFLIGRRKSKKR